MYELSQSKIAATIQLGSQDNGDVLSSSCQAISIILGDGSELYKNSPFRSEIRCIYVCFIIATVTEIPLHIIYVGFT